MQAYCCAWDYLSFLTAVLAGMLCFVFLVSLTPESNFALLLEVMYLLFCIKLILPNFHLYGICHSCCWNSPTVLENKYCHMALSLQTQCERSLKVIPNLKCCWVKSNWTLSRNLKQKEGAGFYLNKATYIFNK